MATETRQEMHQDHRNWQSESAFWRDQIREWQQQTSKAMDDLTTIRSALEKHERSLERHAAAVLIYDQNCAEHEHQLATLAPAAPYVAAECSGGSHAAEAGHHAHVRDRHEILKQQHHALMARWALLLQSLQGEL